MSEHILTCNEKKGLILEFLTSLVLNLLGVKHRSNPFDPWEWKKRKGLGVDHETCGTEIEDKNLSPHYHLTPFLAEKKIVSRFSESKDKLLVISMLNGTPETLEILRKNGIDTLQVGFQVTEDNMIPAIIILAHKFSIHFKRRGMFNAQLFLLLIYGPRWIYICLRRGFLKLLRGLGTVLKSVGVLVMPPLALYRLVDTIDLSFLCW
jgi:hypothetical protein